MFQIDESPDSQCFAKAKAKGEETFTLRAQDQTSGAIVLAWMIANWFNKDVTSDAMRDSFESAISMRDWPNQRAATRGTPVQPSAAPSGFRRSSSKCHGKAHVASAKV